MDKVIRQIEEAMRVLRNASCGGIGPVGATLEDLKAIWARGIAYGDDAYADTCQHVFRLLEKALKSAKNRAARKQLERKPRIRCGAPFDDVACSSFIKRGHACLTVAGWRAGRGSRI